MKKEIRSFLLIMLWIISLAGLSNAQSENKDNVGRVLEVQFNKKTYVLNEPIFAEFKVKLLTSDDKPIFQNDTLVKIKFRDEIKQFGGLTANTGTPIRFPKTDKGYENVFPSDGTLQPLSESSNGGRLVLYDKEVAIERVEEFFPESGNYEIRFFLSGISKELASNSINLTIEEPTGINKDAFDFLNKHKDGFSFNWVYEEKDGINALKTFVERFSQSVYGETAIRRLGLYYFNRDEQDKAQAEFEKLKSSKNKTIVENAEKSLIDVANRKIYLERMKQSPQD